MAAGLIGSAGGITSMVSYPALLAVGLGPVAASVANTIALVACWPGSALASGAELRGRWRWLARWCPVAAGAGVIGSVMLLLTPSGTFEIIVPFFVLLGSAALLLEPWLRQRSGQRTSSGNRIGLPAGVSVLSLYNGYFGAGSGVLTLTLMLWLVDSDLLRANALKNGLIGAGVVASAATFVATSSVRWAAVVPLAAGMLVGSNLGPRVARRIPAPALRLAISCLGVALAIELLLDAVS